MTAGAVGSGARVGLHVPVLVRDDGALLPVQPGAGLLRRVRAAAARGE